MTQETEREQIARLIEYYVDQPGYALKAADAILALRTEARRELVEALEGDAALFDTLGAQLPRIGLSETGAGCAERARLIRATLSKANGES